MDNEIPDIVTQDRSNVHEIIEEMIENPDAYGIYHTTKTFNQLEALLNTARIEAVGWTWAKACLLLDDGKDPRGYEMSQLIEQATKDLNPPWKYEKKE